MIQEVDHVERELHLGTEVIIHTREGLPTSLEEEGVGLVDVALRDVAHLCPDTPIAEGIAGIDAELQLVEVRDVVSGEIILLGHAIAEGGGKTKVAVLRVAQGEKQMYVKAGEGADDGIGGPTQRGHAIDCRTLHRLRITCGHAMGRSGEHMVEVATHILVVLLDIDHLRHKVQPTVLQG